MMATAPFAQTPRMTVTTELKSANFKGGRSSVRIQLYGVPETVSYTHLTLPTILLV